METSIGQHWHFSKVLLNHEESRSCRSRGQQNIFPHLACNTARNFKYDTNSMDFLNSGIQTDKFYWRIDTFWFMKEIYLQLWPLPLKDLSLGSHPMQVELYKPLEDYRNSQWFHRQCNHLGTMSRKHQMLKFDKSSALELHSQLTITVSQPFYLGRIPLPGTKTSEALMWGTRWYKNWK